MLSLPSRLAPVILAFAPLFSRRVWCHAQALLLGAILAPGKRTVTSCLRILGSGRERRFTNYHRVLNRACWSPRAASCLLLNLLVRAFVPTGPVVLGMDDTIERRRGQQIKAKGIYRDPVRSSDAHFVKASGLRWLSLMLLAPVPWAGRCWALPFLTCLAPSARAQQQQGKRHKKLTDWAWQMALQARRWLPGRSLVLVTDSSFAALELLAALARHMSCITRLRLDAALYEPSPPRAPGTNGRPRTKGRRLPTLREILGDQKTRWQTLQVAGWYGDGERTIEVCSATAVWRHSGLPVVPIRWVLVRDPAGRFAPQALLCTDLSATPRQILAWFVRRWQVEVTFEEVRRHLGVETQRQWSDLAIARSTPGLLALFSVTTLLAKQLVRAGKLAARQDAWYVKTVPTFSDTLAAVRLCLWRQSFGISPRQTWCSETTNTRAPLLAGGGLLCGVRAKVELSVQLS